MNIIMDSTRKFGILWEKNSECNGFIYGKIQIIIGENIYPKICPYEYFTLNTVFNSLKSSLKRSIMQVETMVWILESNYLI